MICIDAIRRSVTRGVSERVGHALHGRTDGGTDGGRPDSNGATPIVCTHVDAEGIAACHAELDRQRGVHRERDRYSLVPTFQIKFIKFTDIRIKLSDLRMKFSDVTQRSRIYK